MTRDPILLVTGLGRCGTTLVMHMLRAAGVPVFGRAPAFENIPLSGGAFDESWLETQRGCAVKWIDPTRWNIRNTEDWRYRAIFLTRCPQDQAASQLKLLGAPADRTMRRGMAARIVKDTVIARRRVDRLCGAHGTLNLSFGALINFPESSAQKIAKFCDSHGFPFGNVEDAAAQVLRRDPACAPDLSIEHMLLRREPE